MRTPLATAKENTREQEPKADEDEHLVTSTPPVTTTQPATPQPTEPTTPRVVQPLLPPHIVAFLNRPDLMVDLEDTTLNAKCKWPEKESNTNQAFMKEFGRIFKHLLGNLPWHLDEGGLIGSCRAGSMINADDDFDFFVLLPNQHAPCRPDSLTCEPEEWERVIHKFLMVFWNEGMCINKFHPDPAKFRSRGRLMYSLQLNRPNDVPPEQCFIEQKAFAHMHLGILNSEGKLQTNIWKTKGSTHKIDTLPLDIMFPVTRCRAGPIDAPCPHNITGYLTVRNGGEYRRYSSDGSCLLVRTKWNRERKIAQVKRTRDLSACGYNSIVDLADAFVASDYKNC